MRSAKLLLMIGMITMTFTACQKEKSLEIPNNTPGNNNGGNNNGGNNGGNNNGTEVGTWKFVNMNLNSAGTIEASISGLATKTITSTNFTTTNNGGTVSFDGKNMTFTNVSYSYNGTMKFDVYISGIKTASYDQPITYDQPAATESFAYTKIGTDSLYFPDAFVTSVDPTGTAQTGPAGAKLKWEGDKLYMTIKVEDNWTEDVQGVSSKVNNKATTITTLQKQ